MPTKKRPDLYQLANTTQNVCTLVAKVLFRTTILPQIAAAFFILFARWRQFIYTGPWNMRVDKYFNVSLAVATGIGCIQLFKLFVAGLWWTWLPL